jgi:hypothetical protein
MSIVIGVYPRIAIDIVDPAVTAFAKSFEPFLGK